jgi:hypothetical protein
MGTGVLRRTGAGVERGDERVAGALDVPVRALVDAGAAGVVEPCPLVVQAASSSPSAGTKRRIYSTQPNVLVTAFFHVEYLASRVVASSAGCQVRSAAQFVRISSVDDQNPTASPAA